MKTSWRLLKNSSFVACFADSMSAAVQAPTVRVCVSSSGIQGNLPSNETAVSDDGRFVLFTSQASNLVPGDTHGTGDAFLRDLATNVTTRVSLVSNGNQGTHGCFDPEISRDAGLLLFSTVSALLPEDTNFETDIYSRGRLTNVLQRESVSSSGAQGNGDSIRPE